MSIILSDYVKIEEIDWDLISKHALSLSKMIECEEKGHVWTEHEFNTNFDDFVFYPTEQSAECMRCGENQHLN